MTGNTLTLTDGKTLWLHKVRHDGYDLHEFLQTHKIKWDKSPESLIREYLKYRAKQGGRPSEFDLVENQKGLIFSFLLPANVPDVSTEIYYSNLFDLAHQEMDKDPHKWDGFLTSYADYEYFIDYKNGEAYHMQDEPIMVQKKTAVKLSKVDLEKASETLLFPIQELIGKLLKLKQVKSSAFTQQALKKYCLDIFTVKNIAGKPMLIMGNSPITPKDAMANVTCIAGRVLDECAIRHVVKEIKWTRATKAKMERVKKAMPKEVYAQLIQVEEAARTLGQEAFTTAVKDYKSREYYHWEWMINTNNGKKFNIYGCSRPEHTLFAVRQQGKNFPHYRTVKEYQQAIHKEICKAIKTKLPLPPFSKRNTSHEKVRATVKKGMTAK